MYSCMYPTTVADLHVVCLHFHNIYLFFVVSDVIVAPTKLVYLYYSHLPVLEYSRLPVLDYYTLTCTTLLHTYIPVLEY